MMCSMIKTQKIIGVSILCLWGSACQPTQNGTTEQQPKAIHKTSKPSLKQQFEVWREKQNPALLQAYHQYVAKHLQHPPSEFELMTNQHFMPAECEWTRFYVPPRKYWKNIIPSLQRIEQLQVDGFFQHYQVTSSFRNPDMNTCVRGASKSKHLYNYAVDFQVLDAHLTTDEQKEKLQKRLCQFWKKEGKRYKMGLGIYQENRFHIDLQGYRTWGSDYSQKSSPCLTL